MDPQNKEERPSSGKVQLFFDCNTVTPLVVVAVVLYSVLFFWFTSVLGWNDVRSVIMGMVILAPIVTLLFFKRSRERMSHPMLLLAAVVGLDVLSILWAVAGKFALNELLKIMGAFSVAVLLLVLTPGDRRQGGRNLAAILCGAMGISSFLSIDTLSTQMFSGPFIETINEMTWIYVDFTPLSGSRMNSIFLNSNVFAACSGVAVFLGLGLMTTAKRHWLRLVYGVLVVLNSVAFLLANSRGAMGVAGVCFVLYLLLERGNRRIPLLITMVAALVCAGGAYVLATRSGALEEWTGVNWVPLAVTLLAGVALGGACCLLTVLEHRIPLERLAKKTTVIFLLLFVLALIGAAVFALVALRTTQALPMEPNQWITRAIYPKPGAYTLTVAYEGELDILVRTQTKDDAMMGTYQTLYPTGSPEEASFEVPEGALAVYVELYSRDSGAYISSATYQGEEESGSIPLKYTFLPESIARRIQGMMVSDSVIIRLMYVEDGLKLFEARPVVGYGVGGFENAIVSVQTTHYETKYAHNHYIQAMVETGTVGLILFVGLVVVSGWAIVRTLRKEDGHPLAAALGGALLFMAGHSAVEVNLSYYAFLPMAYATFALIGLCCGDGMKIPKVEEKVWKTGGVALVCVVCVAFSVALGGNLQARRIMQDPTFDSLVEAAKVDPFEKSDYMLSYVVSSFQYLDSDPEIAQQAEVYAKELEQVNSNTIPLYLMMYYFQTNRVEQALAMGQKYVEYVPSDQEAWNETFGVLMQYEQSEDPVFCSGVLRLVDIMNQWNESHLGKLVLNEEAAALVERCGGTVPQSQAS